jgi:hypothetical protein
MSAKRIVALGSSERKRCLDLVKSGTAHARSILHAHVLLKADQGDKGPAWTDEAISEAFGVCTETVRHIRKVKVEDGLDAALSHYRGPNREYTRKLDGHQEAQLIALACSEPPTGRKRWTLRLLTGQFVELGYIEAISHQTVYRTLKKTSFNLGDTCSG